MIWELAGVLGVHPGPFSLRELFAMMTARRMHTWDWVTRICNRIRPNDEPLPAYCAGSYAL